MDLSEAAPDLLSCTEEGSLRIAGTRVTLESVIQAFKDGAAPEEICQDYPSVTLAQVYSSVAFYLTHQEAVDIYLTEQDQAATAVRGELATRYASFLAELRQRLLGRRPSSKPRA